MRNSHWFIGSLLIVSLSSVLACGNSGDGTVVTPTTPTPVTTTTSEPTPTPSPTPTPTPTPTPIPDPTPTTAPSIYAQFGNGVQVTMAATTVTLRTTDVPDHPSPYFGVGHALYEAPGADMRLNPHSIAAQNIVLRVPLAPAVGTPSDTPLGPIGIAVNGVVFFNQYAAGRQPLTGEIQSFDRFNGHPAPSNQYHYHVEPRWLTASSKSRFLGVLLDGFPVYGTQDANGATPADLDVCHGHVGATSEFPNGLYHYHVTDASPYISGCFRGTPGSVG